MAGADVLMDYDAVDAMSDAFGASATVLGGVSKALEAIATLLQATAFIGGIGAAAAAYVSNIQQNVQKLTEICNEFELDLQGAITSIRDGDFSGSQRFV